METSLKRVCRYCGDALRGRTDKVFCDDRCRNQFHNQKQRVPVLSESARRVQRQLLKNRRVLEGVLQNRNRCLVERDLLLQKGFSFDFFSHSRTARGGLIIFCLDLGYRKKSARRLEIVRTSEPMGVLW